MIFITILKCRKACLAFLENVPTPNSSSISDKYQSLPMMIYKPRKNSSRPHKIQLKSRRANLSFFGSLNGTTYIIYCIFSIPPILPCLWNFMWTLFEIKLGKNHLSHTWSWSYIIFHKPVGTRWRKMNVITCLRRCILSKIRYSRIWQMRVSSWDTRQFCGNVQLLVVLMPKLLMRRCTQSR